MFRLTFAALACLATPAAADRILAEAACSSTETELHFDCEIALSEGGAPVANAAFTVRPDMPSMPMAHNMPTVPAETTGRPGIYSARLALQMSGDWTLTLDLTAPRRDRIVLSHTFQDAANDAAPDHRSMDHSGHGGSN